jgi:hypothetical protein
MPPIVVRIEPKMFPRTSSLLQIFLPVAVGVQCSNRWVDRCLILWKILARLRIVAVETGQAPEWYLNQSNQIVCDGEFKIMSVISGVRSCNKAQSMDKRRSADFDGGEAKSISRTKTGVPR